MMIGDAMTPFDPVFTVDVKKVDGKFDVTVFDVTIVEVDVNFFRCNPLSPYNFIMQLTS